MFFFPSKNAQPPISDRRNQTSTRAARSPTYAACCIREDNSHAHHPAETTFSAHTDNRPYSKTAAARRSSLRRHRSPYLFRTRSRQRNNRAPSPSAKSATSTDQNPTALRLPNQTPPACRRSRSAKAIRRHSACRLPRDACKAQSRWSSHKHIAHCPQASLQSSADNHETPDQPAPAESMSHAGFETCPAPPAPCDQSECCPSKPASSS